MDEAATRGRRWPAGRKRRRRRAATSTMISVFFLACAAGIPRVQASLRPPPVVSMPCGTTWEQAFAQIEGLNIKRSTLKAHPEILSLLPDPEIQPSTMFAVSDRAYVNLLSDPSALVTAELDNFEARMPLGKAASMWLFRALPAPYSAEDLRGLKSAPTALAFATEMGKYSLGFQPIHISGIDNVLIDDLLPTVQATPVLASYKVCSSWLHVIEQYLVPATAFNVSKIPDPVPGGHYTPQQAAEVPQPLPSSLEIFNERTRAQMPKPWEWRKKMIIGAAVGGSLAVIMLLVIAAVAFVHGRRARDRSLEDGRKAGIELGLAEASRALSHGIPLTGGLSGGLQLPGSTAAGLQRNGNGGFDHNGGGFGGPHVGARRDSNNSGGELPIRSPRLSGVSARSAASAADVHASNAGAAAPASVVASDQNSGSMRRGARFLRFLRHGPKDDSSGGGSGFVPASLPPIKGSGHSGNPYEIADDDDGGGGGGRSGGGRSGRSGSGSGSGRGGALRQHGSFDGTSASAAAPQSSISATATTTASPEALFPDLSSLGTGWEIDGSSVRILTDPTTGLPRKLGEGGFGSVFLAEMDGATPVAVKIVSNQQPREVRRFVQEVSILKSLRHTNVVQFLGAYFSTDRIALLTEFLPRGDLHRLLGRDTSGQLGWYRRGRAIALDVVRGIVYMHSRKPPVAHLDLKPANCLLGRDWTCKIADVGLAKVLNREDTQVSLEGTFEWAAPEVLSGERVCEKADLFALSVILYEIVTGEAPRNRQLREIRCPEECPAEVRDVIERCRLRDPQQRPTAKEVYDVLSATPPTGIHHPMGGSTAMFAGAMSSQASAAFGGAGAAGSVPGSVVGGGSVFGSSTAAAAAAPAAVVGSLGAAPSPGLSSSSDGGGGGSGAAGGASLLEARSSGSAAVEAAATSAAATAPAAAAAGGTSIGSTLATPPPTPFSSQTAPTGPNPVPAPPRRVAARLPPSAFSCTPPN